MCLPPLKLRVASASNIPASNLKRFVFLPPPLTPPSFSPFLSFSGTAQMKRCVTWLTAQFTGSTEHSEEERFSVKKALKVFGFQCFLSCHCICHRQLVDKGWGCLTLQFWAEHMQTHTAWFMSHQRLPCLLLCFRLLCIVEGECSKHLGAPGVTEQSVSPLEPYSLLW